MTLYAFLFRMNMQDTQVLLSMFQDAAGFTDKSDVVFHSPKALWRLPHGCVDGCR